MNRDRPVPDPVTRRRPGDDPSRVRGESQGSLVSDRSGSLALLSYASGPHPILLQFPYASVSSDGTFLGVGGKVATPATRPPPSGRSDYDKNPTF